MKPSIILVSIVTACTSNAAEIRYVEGDSGTINNLWIIGAIERGDAELFAQLASSPPREKEAIRVVLVSGGGDLVEAMKIGNQIREGYIPTFAVGTQLGDKCATPDDVYDGEYRPVMSPAQQSKHCGCNSACFAVWAGGPLRHASELGVHRPKFDESYFSGLSASEAEKKYETMSSDVESYFAEMGVPPALVETIFSTSSSELHRLSESDVRSLTSPPGIAEWLTSKCGEVSREEQADMEEYLGHLLQEQISGQSAMTDVERKYFALLSEKSNEISRCRANAIIDEQLARRE